MIEKNRDLSLFKFFEQLQLEYIIAELRKKIYPSQKDKLYYSKVMERKLNKIQDICLRNSLPSIFNNEDTKVKMYKKIYNEKGFPNFTYRDEIHRLEIEILDIKNYYKEGKEVKVYLSDDSIEVGTIESVNIIAKLVEVKFSKEKILNFPMKDVTAIL